MILIKISQASIIAVALSLSSCASIVSKSSYPLIINTNPSNVRVSITDKRGKEIFLGNSPATVKLKAGAGYFTRAEYQVKLSSPGYDDKIVPVTFTLDGWYFGNLFLGGVLGMLIIDPATGAMWKLETEFINETMSKSPTSSTNPELQILNLANLNEDQKSHLIRLF